MDADVSTGLRDLDRMLARRAAQRCAEGLAPLRKLIEQRAYWEINSALAMLSAAPHAQRVQSLRRSLRTLLFELRLTQTDLARETYGIYELDVNASVAEGQLRYLTADMRSLGWAGL